MLLRRSPVAPACVAAVAAIVLVMAGSRSGASDDAKPAAAPVVVGKAAKAQWTATTQEAAATEANKKTLAAGKPATVTGEVVDLSCFLQLGKRGEAHVACGTKCLESGEPIGLVDKNGEVYVLFAEEHHPRRDGQTDLHKVFIPLLAKQVTVTGMEQRHRGVRSLFVQAFEIGAGKDATTP
jgi:hypothetical protein